MGSGWGGRKRKVYELTLGSCRGKLGIGGIEVFSGANTYVGPGCAWGVGELVDGGGGGGGCEDSLD